MKWVNPTLKSNSNFWCFEPDFHNIKQEGLELSNYFEDELDILNFWGQGSFIQKQLLRTLGNNLMRFLENEIFVNQI